MLRDTLYKKNYFSSWYFLIYCFCCIKFIQKKWKSTKGTRGL